MKQINPFYICLLILLAIGVNVSAQNVQIDQSLKDKTFESVRVLEVKGTTNAAERLENIANNPEAQQAYDEKVANSNQNENTLPEPQTISIERNLENNPNIDLSTFRNNAQQRRQNFDFEQYRSTIGSQITNLKGN